MNYLQVIKRTIKSKIMERFIGATYELHYIETKSKRDVLKKIANYIIDNLNDLTWQNSISNQLCKGESIHRNKIIFITLRLFHQKEIEEGKLKSYARYKKADDKLVIDQMFVLDDYTDLPEDEMREKLCNDTFDYAKKMLEKYKDRFPDFDAMAFIPFLRERFEQTKKNELPYYNYENSK